MLSKEAVLNSTAKLFIHGRSQAVHLPRGISLESTGVLIRKIGDKVILEPLKRQAIDFEKFWAECDALGASDFLPEGIPDELSAESD